MIVSCHQPNFCPWLPFFEKIKRADIFVILGHVQFEKNNYQNRFLHQGDWHTMSVTHGMIPIREKTYANPLLDWQKIVLTFPQLKIFSHVIGNNLLKTNTEIIKIACKAMGITTSIVLDYETNLRGSERLLDLCKHYGATEYLSGPSGRNYLDQSIFEKAGIKINYQTNEKDRRSLFEIL